MSGKKEKKSRVAYKIEPDRPLCAVVELGSSAIRMAIAQIDKRGKPRVLESLQQAVSLGKDVFTTGSISREITEECVKTLMSYSKLLAEYGITDPARIRVVATSAVREASNRNAFIDRIYIATNLNAEVLDEAEVNRYTYLSVHSLLRAEPSLKDKDAVIVEVGGGSTDVLVLRQGKVVLNKTYRIGSLRLRNLLGDHEASTKGVFSVLVDQIDRTVEQIVRDCPGKGSYQILALGGDARFACEHFHEKWDRKGLASLKVSQLTKLADQFVLDPVDALVKKFHISYAQAEAIGPALLSYARLAKAFKMKRLLVSGTSVREGLLYDMAPHGALTKEFNRQVVSSALSILSRFGSDLQHAHHVESIAMQLFDALQSEHRLSSRARLILRVAALLHEIGGFVSNRSHHKHSMYLIQNSDIFGLGAKDKALTALVARYHRRALPKATHEGYCVLHREDRVLVSKLAAILRVADALARGPGTRNSRISLEIGADQVVITVSKAVDLTLEQHALIQKGEMFQQVYGKSVVARPATGGPSNG